MNKTVIILTNCTFNDLILHTFHPCTPFNVRLYIYSTKNLSEVLLTNSLSQSTMMIGIQASVEILTSILIILMICGLIEIILISLFWKYHLSKHKSHPVYRIRNPLFWMISLIGSAVFVITRSIILCLAINHKISQDLFIALGAFTLIFLAFSFFFGRYV